MRIEPALFDLDGTLVDSVYQHVLAWKRALDAEGIELSVWRIHRKIGMSGGLFTNKLLHETGIEISAERAERLRHSHIVEGAPTWEAHHAKVYHTIALRALVDTSAAVAQAAGLRNPLAATSTNSDWQVLPEAPVGHRQPRADEVPSEKNLMAPNDLINQEKAALDHMINGICRGC
jgi:beta-phosphoglucomutase-like phosphatase (HAD superfamily)